MVVMDELNQQEANHALVLLQKASIDALKEGHSVRKANVYAIKVRKSRAEEALQLLVAHHLPRMNRAGLKEIYPPGSLGIIPSKSDELAKLIMANQGEVESLLKIVPGIYDARVVFSFEQPEFSRTAPKKTASVAIIYSHEKNGPPLSDDEVKKLLASSIAGLLPEDVAVVQKMSPEIRPYSTSTQTDASARDTKPLLALTLLALILSAYSAFRLLWQKRALDGK